MQQIVPVGYTANYSGNCLPVDDRIGWPSVSFGVKNNMLLTRLVVSRCQTSVFYTLHNCAKLGAVALKAN